ncbi:hypothetical protein FOA52_008428 [Chlamydomonas sp. UWO 241]|nr:hypothetical protein FOA52_008428 [Chlamydomonas sp. UWO 241]
MDPGVFVKAQLLLSDLQSSLVGMRTYAGVEVSPRGGPDERWSGETAVSPSRWQMLRDRVAEQAAQHEGQHLAPAGVTAQSETRVASPQPTASPARQARRPSAAGAARPLLFGASGATQHSSLELYAAELAAVDESIQASWSSRSIGQLARASAQPSAAAPHAGAASVQPAPGQAHSFVGYADGASGGSAVQARVPLQLPPASASTASARLEQEAQRLLERVRQLVVEPGGSSAAMHAGSAPVADAREGGGLLGQLQLRATMHQLLRGADERMRGEVAGEQQQQEEEEGKEDEGQREPEQDEPEEVARHEANGRPQQEERQSCVPGEAAVQQQRQQQPDEVGEAGKAGASRAQPCPRDDRQPGAGPADEAAPAPGTRDNGQSVPQQHAQQLPHSAELSAADSGGVRQLDRRKQEEDVKSHLAARFRRLYLLQVSFAAWAQASRAGGGGADVEQCSPQGSQQQAEAVLKEAVAGRFRRLYVLHAAMAAWVGEARRARHERAQDAEEGARRTLVERVLAKLVVRVGGAGAAQGEGGGEAPGAERGGSTMEEQQQQQQQQQAAVLCLQEQARVQPQPQPQPRGSGAPRLATAQRAKARRRSATAIGASAGGADAQPAHPPARASDGQARGSGWWGAADDGDSASLGRVCVSIGGESSLRGSVCSDAGARASDPSVTHASHSHDEGEQPHGAPMQQQQQQQPCSAQHPLQPAEAPPAQRRTTTGSVRARAASGTAPDGGGTGGSARSIQPGRRGTTGGLPSAGARPPRSISGTATPRTPGDACEMEAALSRARVQETRRRREAADALMSVGDALQAESSQLAHLHYTRSLMLRRGLRPWLALIAARSSAELSALRHRLAVLKRAVLHTLWQRVAARRWAVVSAHAVALAGMRSLRQTRMLARGLRSLALWAQAGRTARVSAASRVLHRLSIAVHMAREDEAWAELCWGRAMAAQCMRAWRAAAAAEAGARLLTTLQARHEQEQAGLRALGSYCLRRWCATSAAGRIERQSRMRKHATLTKIDGWLEEPAAILRLQHDLRQLQVANLCDVVAAPNGDDLARWSCNMVACEGKWKGMVVHLHLEFKPDYPMRPPTVEIQTPLQGHPNIYGSYICLDMLTQPQGKEDEGKGEAVAAKEAPAAAGVSGSSSPSAVCSLAASEGVGASGRTSDSSGTVQGTTTFAAAADVDIDLLALLDDPLLHCVLQRLRPQDLHRCQRVGGRLARVAADVLQRSELQCFHSKLGFGDALLGFGVQRSWHHSSSQLRGVSVAAGEYLSYAAFQKGVRLSAWNGGTPFDAFLPLYLNPEHGARCMKELPMFVDGLNDRGCSSGQPAGVRCAKVYARALLRVLGHMLNSLAFCHLHHLLLAVALQPGSGVAELARHDVRAFMTQPAARTKEACPDLGVLLVELLLVPCSDAPWEQFAPVLLREVLARQVRWAIKETGDWFGSVGRETASPNGDSVDDVRRLRTHWECGKVGLRLVMLQTWFANALARPLSAATATADLARAKRAYDECSGLPPRATMDAFATHARSVVAATKWLQVLAALRLGFRHGANPRAVFAAALRQAVLDSHRARYHASPSPGAPPRVRTAAPSAAAGEWQSVAARERAVPCYLDWRSAPIGMTANVWV